MYGSATARLFEELPELQGLDGDHAQRVLSNLYVEILARRLTAEALTEDDRLERHLYLRRLASALESYAIFDELDDPAQRGERLGAAFVAAEALSLAAEVFPTDLSFRYRYRLEHPKNMALIEAGLLYLAAGFDANAGPCARSVPACSVGTRSAEARFAEWACDVLRSLLFLRPDIRSAPRSTVYTGPYGGYSTAELREVIDENFIHPAWDSWYESSIYRGYRESVITGKLIHYREVDERLGLPPGTAKRYLVDVAAGYDIKVDRQWKNSVRFKYSDPEYASEDDY